MLADPAAPAVPESHHPIRALQESMLLRYVLDSGAHCDIEQAVLRLAPGVDVTRLQRAWQTVVAHHPALRSGFRWSGFGDPSHVVTGTVDATIALDDAGPLAAHACDAAIDARAAAERDRRFDLSSASLHRMVLVLGGPAGSALIWTNHHAVLDGRSRAVVLRDLVRAYAGHALEPATGLAGVGAQAACRSSAAERFWRERLTGAASLDLLPAALRPGAHAAHHGTPRRFGTCARTLPDTASAAVREFARVHGVTLTTVAHAAWSIALARYAGTRDVVFGAVRACREPGTDDRGVGLYMNTVPVRSIVDVDADLAPWLSDLRRSWNGLRRFEQTPAHLVQTWSGSTSGTPLFESVVMVERERFCDIARGADADGALGILDAAMHSQSAVPVVFSLTGTATIDLRIQYDADRFDAAAMRLVLERIEAILSSLTAPETARVGDVSLFVSGERETICNANRTTAYARDESIHTLFIACAQRAPDAIALRLGDARLTYRELDERSDRIAAYLLERGIGRGAFVGLCAERSFDMIAALLGILKSGAASVALDPGHPGARLTAMLDEARVDLILVTVPANGAFASVSQAVIADIVARPCGPVAVAPAAPEDPAHVMYTSGSTGVPKGAVIPHRAAIRTVCGSETLTFGAGETLLAFVPLTFDVAILEIWGALINGATLAICPPGLPSLDELGATIASAGVTTLWLTSAMFEQMIATQIESLRGVRQLIVGGDVMSPDVARRAVAGLPATRIFNVYGPTEATVLITAQPLAEPLPTPIPVGAPIANTTVYILDEQRRLLPAGMPGEIYTGGDGLALGYLNRPDLTAERFIADPFSVAGARMYRTGDRARWRTDGSIDFLGRTDHQVKIRGVRVEPAEVDAVLVRHPGVEQTVTIARTINGSKQLVAYVTRNGAAPVGEDALHALARAHLPDAMRPAVIVLLERMPLTATGKIDRIALPAPAGTGHAAERGRPPSGAVEIAIAAQAAELLGLEHLARDDDFFEAGGDSLLAMRLVAQLRETFGVPLTVSAFAGVPTVAGIAARIARLTRDPAGAPDDAVRALRTGGTKPPLFFFHGDLAGGGRYTHALAQHIDPARAVYVLDADTIACATAATSIADIARAGIAEIIRREPHGPYAIGGFCAGGLVAHETARQLVAAGHRVEHVLVIDGFATHSAFAPLAAAAEAVFSQAAVPRIGALAALLRAARRDGRSPLAVAVAGALRRMRGGIRSHDEPPPDQSWETWHAARITRWERLTARHIPRSYAGALTLLWSEETAGSGDAFMQQWRRIARSAVAAYVPGTHLTSIAQHLAVTARIVAQRLDPDFPSLPRRMSQ